MLTYNEQIYNAFVCSGIHLVPCTGKMPVIRWARGKTYQTPQYNAYKNNSWAFIVPPTLLVIDIDIKNGKNGLNELSRFIDTQKLFNQCKLIVKTPSGGYHLYFNNSDSKTFRTAVASIDGVEMKTNGKHLCMIPCPPDYEILNPDSFEVAIDVISNLRSRLSNYTEALTTRFVKQYTTRIRDKKDISMTTEINYKGDLELRIENAIVQLKNHGQAVQNQGGDLHTFKAACIGINTGLTKETFFPLLKNWNTSNIPPWSESELLIKLHSAYNQDPLPAHTPLPKKPAQSANPLRDPRTAQKLSRADSEHLSRSLFEHTFMASYLEEQFKTSLYISMIKSRFECLMQFIELHPYIRDRLAMNEFSLRPEFIEYLDQPYEGDAVDITEATIKIKRILSRHYIENVKSSDISDCLSDILTRHTYNPVVNYFNSLPDWDGVPRVAHLFSKYCNAPNTPYSSEVGRLLLCGIVARTYTNGCKFDYMPILKSKQGHNKSKLLELLALRKTWFTGNFTAVTDPKGIIEQTSGKLIIEWQEMRGYDRSNVDAYKACISTQVDNARVAYARNPKDVPRKFVIVATTNNDTVLKDPTGNRRMLPIEVSNIDIESIHRDLLQLYAEAKYMYNQSHFKLYMTDQQTIEEFKQICAGEYEEDDYKWCLTNWIRSLYIHNPVEASGEDPFILSTDSCIAHCISRTGISVNLRTRVVGMLQQLGYYRKTIRVNNMTKKFYVLEEKNEWMDELVQFGYKRKVKLSSYHPVIQKVLIRFYPDLYDDPST